MQIYLVTLMLGHVSLVTLVLVHVSLVTLMLGHVSSKKMCLWRHSIYHLKAHRIGNTTHKYYRHRVRRENVMVIKCYNFQWF